MRTKALLSCYISNKNAKHIWVSICHKLNKLEGFKGTGDPVKSEQVRSKIRSLEDKYKRTKRHNEKSGNNALLISEDLEEAFGEDKYFACNDPFESAKGAKGKKIHVLYK